MKKIYRIISFILILATLTTIMSVGVFAAEGNTPYIVTTYDAHISYDSGNRTTLLTYPDNMSEYALTVTPKAANTTIKVFADPKCKYPLSAGEDGDFVIIPKQMDTYIYVMATRGNSSAKYRICMRSKRSAVRYTDFDAISNWAKPYVNYCNELGYGIIQGDTMGKVHPHHPLTRYEIALIAARMLGTDCTQYSAAKVSYNDKIAGWAKEGITAMTANGIISGNKYGNKFYFDGDRNVTREQVAKIMVNVALLRKDSAKTAEQLYKANKDMYDQLLKRYADYSDISDWARPYMALAVGFELISGSKDKNGKLHLYPKSDISRQEMITMVARDMGYDISVLLQDLLTVTYDLLQSGSLDKVTKNQITKTYNSARSAYNSNNDSTKEAAYIRLYERVRDHLEYGTAAKNVVVYLSPSNQMANEYTGVNTTEGAQMQAVAALLKPMLEEMGFTVVVADPSSRIYGRENEAAKVGADIYVAIHSNATGTVNKGSAQGSIVFYSNNKGSKELAECINEKISAVTPTKDTGIVNDGNHTNPYHEIKSPTMANVLVEVEYHDYGPYANWIVNNKEALARAFAEGILQYYLNQSL